MATKKKPDTDRPILQRGGSPETLDLLPEMLRPNPSGLGWTPNDKKDPGGDKKKPKKFSKGGRGVDTGKL